MHKQQELLQAEAATHAAARVAELRRQADEAKAEELRETVVKVAAAAEEQEAVDGALYFSQ